MENTESSNEDGELMETDDESENGKELEETQMMVLGDPGLTAIEGDIEKSVQQTEVTAESSEIDANLTVKKHADQKKNQFSLNTDDVLAKIIEEKSVTANMEGTLEMPCEENVEEEEELMDFLGFEENDDGSSFYNCNEYPGEESTVSKEKDLSSASKSELGIKYLTSILIHKQNKGEETSIAMERETSTFSGSEVNSKSQSNMSLNKEDKEEECTISIEKETYSSSKSELNSKSQENILMDKQNKGEERAISIEKETTLDSTSEVDGNSQRIILMDMQNRGEEAAIPMVTEISSVTQSEVDGISQTNMSMNKQGTDFDEYPGEERAISIEKETILASTSKVDGKSQRIILMDKQNEDFDEYPGEERAISIEKETTLDNTSEVEGKYQRIILMDKQNKGEEAAIPMVTEISSVTQSEVDGISQANMSMNKQSTGEESTILIEKETYSASKSELDSKSQKNILMDKRNKDFDKYPGEERAISIEKEITLDSRSEVNGNYQRSIIMDKQNKGEEDAISIEKETSSVSKSEVNSKSQRRILMDKQYEDEEIAIIWEKETSSVSESGVVRKSQTNMSKDKQNKENQKEKASIEICHFYNRAINGCNIKAEECNWLHVCTTCYEEHPVKVCKIQKEKENLKKMLFRRGRRGGRNACEKRDIDVCYYYNRNLNGCKKENCKLSHECFCCGEGHPIIACDHTEVKNTYKLKCYHFNRGLLGCKEKKCEKVHCCFVCSKGHPFTSCSQKKQIDIAAVDGKSENKKTAQAFDIPYNYSATPATHDNDGPLCFAFNEGPNGCTEPTGTCKSVHACYTCGESHPISSCKQKPNKSTTKITRRKGKTKSEKKVEKLAKKIAEKKDISKKIEEEKEIAKKEEEKKEMAKKEEEKKEMAKKEEAKKEEEKKELAVLKLEEKIRLKKANTTPKYPKITSNPTTVKADNVLTKTVTKHKPISPPRPSKDIRISKEICHFFNNGGCRKSTNCPFFHGCSLCKGNHPVDKCRNKHNSKIDFCSYFNRGVNGCRNVENCPFVHACKFCGGDHTGVRCTDKSSVLHRNYEDISVTIKSYEGSNVKKVSNTSSHEQYKSVCPSVEYQDSFMERSGLIPSRSSDIVGYHDYDIHRSRDLHRVDEARHLVYRSRSREREISIEREYIGHYRSRSRERHISPERDHLKHHRSDRELQLSRERDHLKHRRSDSIERLLSLEKMRQRSRSRERVKLITKRLAREHRSRSRERYRSPSRERSISSAERIMVYQLRKSKTGRAVSSSSGEKRSRSRERNAGISSSSDYTKTSRLQKHLARESAEHHTKREEGNSSRGSMSSNSGSFDAVESCIILSNFCSDLGLLGPTLEEICKRALSDKDNIIAYFRDTEVRETMELVSQKLEKLKSKSTNELHKEKYNMGLAKIKQLLKFCCK